MPRVLLEIMLVAKDCQTLEEFNLKMADMIGESFVFTFNGPSFGEMDQKEINNSLDSLRNKQATQESKPRFDSR